MNDAPSEATLRSGTARTLWSGVGALLPLLGGGGSIAATGPSAVNLTVTVIGALLTTVVAVDFPLRTVVGHASVRRHCPLRTHVIELDSIDRFTRTAPRRRIDDGRPRVRPGAPVAMVGRRRVLLLATCETRAENDAACSVLAAVSPALADSMRLPPGTARDDVSSR